MENLRDCQEIRNYHCKRIEEICGERVEISREICARCKDGDFPRKASIRILKAKIVSKGVKDPLTSARKLLELVGDKEVKDALMDSVEKEVRTADEAIGIADELKLPD